MIIKQLFMEIFGNYQKKIIGIFQIVHGITENMERYKEFAKYFCKKGFLVFGINVTGHGKSLYAGKIKGYFGNEGSWQSKVENVYQSYLLIKKQYANIPYYLIGFLWNHLLLGL